LVSAGEFADVDEVRATAEHDMLRIDNVIESRMQVGVRATTFVRLTLEKSDAGSSSGKSDCC
jgi:hypothetical protein